MSVRTLIEITADTASDHDRDLRATLDKLGFQPKDDAEQVRFMSDLYREMDDRGLKPWDLVEAQRKKRGMGPA